MTRPIEAPRAYEETERQASELAALRRMLAASAGVFSLSVAVCNSPALRDYLIERLKSARADAQVVPLPAGIRDVFDFVAKNTDGAELSALFVVDLEASLDSQEEQFPILRALNASRELWMQSFAQPVVLWLPEFAVGLLAEHARDFWRWRSHQFDFASEFAGAVAGVADRHSGGLDLALNLGVDEKHMRIAELEQRIEEAGEPPEPSMAGHVHAWLNELGALRQMLGDRDAASVHHENALRIARESHDRAGEATALNNIGAVHQALGEFDPALDFFQQALPIRREVGDRAGEATTLNNIGLVHQDRGDLDDALNFYQQALGILREVGDRAHEAGALNNIGAVHQDRGDLDDALNFYQQTLGILREVGDRAHEAGALNNIGAVHRDRGDLDAALDSYEQALGIHRQVGNRAGEATTLNNIGAVHRARGELDPALDFYQQALPIRREVGDRAGESTTLNNIGSVHRARGDLGAAVDFFQQARTIMREVGDRAGEAVTLFNIGTVHEAREELTQAVKLFQQTVAIDEAIGHPDLESDRRKLEEVRGRLEAAD